MNSKYILPMDDITTLKNLEDIILSKRKNLFTKPKKGEGLVLIVSGGLDTTVALARILNETDAFVYPLYIQRGARAEKNELDSLHFYINKFAKKYPNLRKLEVIKAEVPPSQLKSTIPQTQLTTIGHTMRNAILQSYALQFAVSVGYRDSLKIRTVFTSLVPDDNFPHCRLIALRANTIVACIDGDDWSWQVTSPFLEDELWGWVSKPEIIKYAFENDIDLSRTYTCTDSSTIACGMCPACKVRLGAFRDAGYKDPIKYKEVE